MKNSHHGAFCAKKDAPMPVDKARTRQVFTATHRPILTADDVRRGLEHHQFVPYYQPKWSIEHDSLQGAEILARWNHPTLGVLAPGQFLPIVLDNNLIEELFEQLFEQGLEMHRALAFDAMPLTLAFNVQPAQLARPGFATKVRDLLSHHGCPAESVIVEVTETGAIDFPAVSLKNLLALRKMGCGVSMDDFGTGFSSMKRLCDMPFSELKLDGSFVRGLDSHPACRTVIANTVTLANALGLSLVVEGVETTDQLAQLKALNCPFVQGYAIARPMNGSLFFDYCLLHRSPSTFSLFSA